MMTDKQMSEKKNEYYEKFVGYDAYGELMDAENEKLLIWQWIEKLVEEVEREVRERIICKDNRMHDFKLVAESPSVENYYQIHECQKCGFKKKTN